MTERPAVVTIGSDRLSASIDPFGAQLCALRDADGVNLLWDGNPAVWAGQAPILFPIVGMLNEGDYRLDGRTHHLPKHGFARHMLFDVAEAEARSVLLRLEADDRTMESYPFRFRLDLRFTIDGACLAVVASVRNLDKRPMPASFGFHPGFRWPLPYGHDRARHRLMFERDEPGPVRRINTDGLVLPDPLATPVVGRRLDLDDGLFVDDALIFDRLNSRVLDYGSDQGPRIAIGFPDATCLGVWTKPGGGFVCIEPWNGIADDVGFDGDFRSKPLIFEVMPGAVRDIEMSIALVA